MDKEAAGQGDGRQSWEAATNILRQAAGLGSPARALAVLHLGAEDLRLMLPPKLCMLRGMAKGS